MNKEEFRKHGNPKGTEYYKVHELLNQWKKDNNIPDNIQCVVHHRNDTEECRKYNDEHYEIYGCNLDGTFEYGKYVVFMTNAEHNTYHHKGKTLSSEQKAKLSETNKGEKNGFYGKKHTEETRQRLREIALGRKLSEETKQKIKAFWKDHKNGFYGKRHSEEAKRKISEAHKGKKLSEETRKKMSEAHRGEKNHSYGKRLSEETIQRIKDVVSQQAKNDSLHYHKYKANNGTLSWYEFRKLFHNNDPQVMQYLNK